MVSFMTNDMYITATVFSNERYSPLDSVAKTQKTNFRSEINE